MSKKPQKRGYCIFCGGIPLTKEHIWADWLEPYLARHKGNTRHIVVTPFERKFGKLHRPGDLRSQTLRVVCAACNHGWMSGIQQSVKANLVSCITKGQISSAEADRRILGAWAAMFTIVYEMAELSLSNSTPVERSALMNQIAMPPDWRLYVARANVTKGELGAWRRAGNLFSGEPLHVMIINLESWVLVTTNVPESIPSSDPMRNFAEFWPNCSGLMRLQTPVETAEILSLAENLIPSQVAWLG